MGIEHSWTPCSDWEHWLRIFTHFLDHMMFGIMFGVNKISKTKCCTIWSQMPTINICVYFTNKHVVKFLCILCCEKIAIIVFCFYCIINCLDSWTVAPTCYLHTMFNCKNVWKRYIFIIIIVIRAYHVWVSKTWNIRKKGIKIDMLIKGKF